MIHFLLGHVDLHGKTKPILSGIYDDREQCWHTVEGVRVACQFCPRQVENDVFFLVDGAGCCQYCYAARIGTPITMAGRA